MKRTQCNVDSSKIERERMGDGQTVENRSLRRDTAKKNWGPRTCNHRVLDPASNLNELGCELVPRISR